MPPGFLSATAATVAAGGGGVGVGKRGGIKRRSQRPAIGLPPASRARNAPLPSSSGGAEPAKLLGQTGGGVAASATPKIERLSNRSSSSGAFEKAVAEAAAAVDCAGNGGGRGGVGRKGAGGRVSGVLANAAVGVVSAGGKAFGRTSLVSHLRGGMGGAASNSSLNSSPISTEEMSSLDMAVSSGGRGATTRIARTMSSASPSSAAAANSGTSPTVAGGANSRGRGDARGLPPPSPYGDNGGGNGASSGGGYRSGALLGSGEDEKRRGGTGGAESWSGPNGLKRGVAMYPGEMEGGAPGSGGRGGTGGERPPPQGNPLNAGIFSPFPPPGSGRRRGRGAGTGDGGGIGTEGGGGGVGGARTPSYGYGGEEEMGGGAGGSQLLFPLPTKEPLAVAPRGHRRHASFDPNTDCFSQHYSLGSGGGSGGGAASVVGRGDGSGRGSHGSLFLQPLGAVDGQGYSVPISGFGSGGSFGGGSFGGSNRRHIRGCSSGSVDLNVLAPVLAEFRNGGGGSGGGSYPTLPQPRSHQPAPPPPPSGEQAISRDSYGQYYGGSPSTVSGSAVSSPSGGGGGGGCGGRVGGDDGAGDGRRDSQSALRWRGNKMPPLFPPDQPAASSSVDQLGWNVRNSPAESNRMPGGGLDGVDVDGSRVEKGTIWIRHPAGMQQPAGGRRQFSQEPRS
eukprot:jgi/Undpi1/219/HiC_scaffold_1.g00216.m1